MGAKAPLAVAGVMLGCCLNVIFLELIVKSDPGAGNLINFAQFVVISIEGFIITLRFGTRPVKIPMREYVTLVVFFFIVSTANNMAFAFNISMTLHLIFRAGSLMANMVLGMIIMGKRYTLSKYLSVIMVSIGIAVCTIASSKDVEKSNVQSTEGGLSAYFLWVLGITILTFALFMSARMGLFQEVLYAKYGKHPREALFFTHCLPLPGFAILYADLLNHINIANQSSLIQLMGFGIPSLWVYIAGNVITQCLCINSVYVLTTECTSLTVTLVVTLRKFISLVISIFYFGNPFTMAHWLGTTCVFAGTILYSDIPGMIRQSKVKAAKKDE